MDINKILNADYLDILFEGRNKQYGGYELRKKYQRRAAIAGLISVLVIGGVFASTMIKPKEPPAPPPPVIKDVNLAEPPPVDPKKPPPPPPVQPPPPVKPTVKFTPPVIKKNEEVKEEDKPEPPKPEENKVVGPTNIKGSDNPDAIDPGLSTPGTGTGKAVEAGPPPDKIFTSVEQMPQPPFDVQKYLAQNIRYPAAAKEDGIQGRVVLQFVVDRDGSVTNIVIQRDIGGGCGKEAERVVRSMPKWKPGKQNGQPVRVYYTLPVSFKLQE
ncbi:energy transducer TonB [Taibaiella helva]|uniref:energy transducer TonB n=1 Tax=Taibaiella helva TaxID=2301235 RepID=UPI000E587CDD|nr:energy transducer TonB [Taibaiella helva]